MRTLAAFEASRDKQLRSVVGTSNTQLVKPFFRWVGGKQNLIQTLLLHIPDDIRERKYYEPFLGGASLFLALNARRAVLSDSNRQLINAFNAVKQWPEEFYYLLLGEQKPVSRRKYLATRKAFNAARHRNGLTQAVRFVFLAQTSFNGIFRVNQRGEFNVPFGKPQPHFPTLEQILAISKKLKRADLKCGDYKDVLLHARKGDFVYLDPPYPPLNGTSSFRHYTPTRFPAEAQKSVAEIAETLSKRGALVLVSNADVAEIRRLYRSWNIAGVQATRSVSCMRERTSVNELLIKNY